MDQSARSVRCFISHKIAKIINHSTLESLSPHQMRLLRLPLPFMSQHKKLHPPDNCVPVPSLGPALRSCALPATVGNRQWKIAYIGARCRTERTLCICRARSSIHDLSLSFSPPYPADELRWVQWILASNIVEENAYASASDRASERAVFLVLNANLHAHAYDLISLASRCFCPPPLAHPCPLHFG